jgi:hypothetical protein
MEAVPVGAREDRKPSQIILGILRERGPMEAKDVMAVLHARNYRWPHPRYQRVNYERVYGALQMLHRQHRVTTRVDRRENGSKRVMWAYTSA